MSVRNLEPTALADGPQNSLPNGEHPLLARRGIFRGRVGAFATSNVPLAAGGIALTGGFPGADILPIARLRSAYQEQLTRADVGTNVLQYHGPSGTDELRAWVAEQQRVDVDRVLITNGALHSVSFAVEALVDPGDQVFVEDPVYPFALRLLNYFGARVSAIATDADGLDVDAVEARLLAGDRPKLLYTVPDFHNPSTVTLSAERRARLEELAVKYGFVIVSDNPYSLLRWSGQAVADFDVETEQVVRAGTFSKLLGPGLRLGWAITPKWLTAAFIQHRLSADQHAGLLTQRVVESVVSADGVWDEIIGTARTAYQERASALHDALKANFGGRIVVDLPEGGLFLWAQLPGVDLGPVLDYARSVGLDFTHGVSFAAPGGQQYRDHARFAFSNANPQQLRQAAALFAEAVEGVGSSQLKGA